MLTLGQENEVHLVVMADNTGESAYESQLFVSHHKGLNYVAANVTVSMKRLTCQSAFCVNITFIAIFNLCALEKGKSLSSGLLSISLYFEKKNKRKLDISHHIAKIRVFQAFIVRGLQSTY